ncbi:hypothetical protein ACFSNO_22695 [Streptomyces cirratus]
MGQWLTNTRRPGGLGKDPDRAGRRAEKPTAVDPDGNPRESGWTVDWQRHYADIAQLLAGGALLADVVPGVNPARRGRRPLARHPAPEHQQARPSKAWTKASSPRPPPTRGPSAPARRRRRRAGARPAQAVGRPAAADRRAGPRAHHGN